MKKSEYKEILDFLLKVHKGKMKLVIFKDDVDRHDKWASLEMYEWCAKRGVEVEEPYNGFMYDRLIIRLEGDQKLEFLKRYIDVLKTLDFK